MAWSIRVLVCVYLGLVILWSLDWQTSLARAQERGPSDTPRTANNAGKTQDAARADLIAKDDPRKGEPAPSDGAKADLDTKGEEALNKAMARLRSPLASERASAADEMGRRGYRFRKQISDALRPMLLTDAESVVRAAAGRALGRLGAREAVPELIKGLSDRAAEVRVVSAAALWRLPDSSAVPALLDHVKDDDRAVREWTALALGVAADARAVPALVSLLDDPERVVRLAAVRSLGRINRPEGLKPLVGYLRSAKRDEEEKDEVVTSIASIEGPARGGALLELLTASGPDATQKLRVIVALGKVGDAQAVPALRKLSLQRGESKAVREAANKAVAAIALRAKNDADAGAADLARP
jgi:HEAT repeat protein